LNSGLRACLAPLEPCLRAFLFWLFWRQDRTFCPIQPELWSSICLFMLPAAVGITVTCYPCPAFLLRWGSHQLFCLGRPVATILLTSASHVAWDDRCASLHPAIGWDEVSWTPCLDWSLTTILPNSASQVARITGMSHLCPASHPHLILTALWSRRGDLFTGEEELESFVLSNRSLLLTDLNKRNVLEYLLAETQ
jgi:hypothetical protein